VVFFAPFRELSIIINKTCHATRAYLVVDGETHVAVTDELRDAAQRAAKAAAESTSAPIRSVLYREASNENVNDARANGRQEHAATRLMDRLRSCSR
jgi:hypothetical protein